MDMCACVRERTACVCVCMFVRVCVCARARCALRHYVHLALVNAVAHVLQHVGVHVGVPRPPVWNDNIVNKCGYYMRACWLVQRGERARACVCVCGSA